MQNERSRKIIVAVAPVGREINPPSVNPLSPQDVANEVIACAQAGASMVHLHVRDSKGNQTEDISDFSKTLDLIRESSDIIIQGSTGGLSTLTLEQRCVAVNDSRVEVASLNMGSVNFGEDVYINRLPDIRYWARRMKEAGVVPELEVFEIGMIATVRNLVGEGTIKPPYYFNFCLGAHWALPADPRCLFYLTTMLNEDIVWGLVHDSMNDLSLLATAMGMGATMLRVGFEDSVYFAPGKFAKTNKELVERLVSLIYQVGFEVAEPDEARKLLGLS
ncbi:MAG: 3-keto-5-aminohexanoate cleavage protein [Deltaproteobacteria bacterium]|nr:MAG: 3-keto-5-aminohexanoate cleavage protein [Deltaproteobacteria bacterium]